MLGLDKLLLADQYAPVGSDRRVEWTEAVAMVDDSLRDFHPRLGDIFRSCLDRGHIDAEPRPGKVGGAYCNSVSKTVLPYVLMNYTDQLRDVVTLAHEFGHAVHGTLSLERQTLPLVPHGPRAGRGAVDVRAASRRRAADRAWRRIRRRG